MKIDDKNLEFARYEQRARNSLVSGEFSKELLLGSEVVPDYFKAPYLFYESQLAAFINSSYSVLELGAGSGMHTLALLRTGASITASDVSPASLEIIHQKFTPHFQNFKTEIADIEKLPFVDNTFDVVCCAGSLSYGTFQKVFGEVRRVLKPEGSFICVDSLNNNPIYRLNRWIHYLRGERTKSTLVNMPSVAKLEAICHSFHNGQVYYFGSISYLMPILSRFFGQNTLARLSDKWDVFWRVKFSAFRFVLVATGLKKNITINFIHG
jgi:ubiquinone/menaquinone biosynthesis C-methylase UbiE